MPKISTPKQDRRVSVNLTPELNEKLVALANFKGERPAVLARRILAEYFDANADIIAAALKAGNAYQQSLEELRESYADN